MELGFPRTSACSLKEQLARALLRNVRLQGHTYVELREDGKRFVLFCTLCLAPCYSDSVLFDHLKGSIHTAQYAAAKATLLKPNPWPFNDGLLFFHESPECEKQLPTLDSGHGNRFLDTYGDDEGKLAIVSYGEKSYTNGNGHVFHDGFGCENENLQTETDAENSSCDGSCNGDNECHDLVIPGVLRGDKMSDLQVRFMGVGQIAARFCGKDVASNGISRIWCEWLGRMNLGDKDTIITQVDHDYAIVTFPYNYNLGRKGLLNDVRYLLTSGPHSAIEENGGPRKKRKSFSDPEDISESLSKQYDSSEEESQSSNSSSSKFLLDECDDQLLSSRIISSKAMRRELRRRQNVAAERMCDICQHKMLPGKDVATLLNRKTGRLVCSSRNVNGAFHLFHISCLIHWILLCELETYAKQLIGPKVKRRSRRKNGGKCNQRGKNREVKSTGKQIYSVFCPECQGTGIHIDGDELEKPTIPLSEMFRYKIKVSDARRAWMKSPEELLNCSTGFYFPTQSEGTCQESVSPLKLLHFYRAAE